jgi:DNA-binding transcriptional LysR family regulator
MRFGYLALPITPSTYHVRATVTIATNDLYHTNLLPSLIRHLRQRTPGIDLHVRAIDRLHLQEQLAAGEIDVALAPLGAKGSEISAEPLWSDRLVTLVGENNPLQEGMTIEAFAAGGHLVDAGHVQVSADGIGTSVVDAILAARGLRRRIVVVLPSSTGVPFVVAATDLIATLPSRIVKGLAPLPGVRVLTSPLPDVEVSPHMFWHSRSQTDPLRVWLRTAIKHISASI